MNTKEYQDVNLYAVGTRVDIDSIEGMQGAEILNINDGGVAIKCELGAYVTISGKSPARIAQPKVIIPETNEDGSIAPQKPPRKQNGVELKVEYDLNPFTIASFAAKNNISYSQALIIVNSTCSRVGTSIKINSKRGKSPSLYSKI